MWPRGPNLGSYVSCSLRSLETHADGILHDRRKRDTFRIMVSVLASGRRKLKNNT